MSNPDLSEKLDDLSKRDGFLPFTHHPHNGRHFVQVSREEFNALVAVAHAAIPVAAIPKDPDGNFIAGLSDFDLGKNELRLALTTLAGAKA